MLVMERRPGAGIYIGDSIRVEVRSVRGSKVKIGIDAPRTVRVWRDELDRSAEEVEAAPLLVDASDDAGSDCRSLSLNLGSVDCGPEGADEALALAADARTTCEAVVAGEGNSADRQVVVVEDDPAHAMIIQSALRQAGVQAVTVLQRGEDVLQAIESGRLGRPSLIMLDLNLPDTSGKELLRHLRQVPDLRFVPVVMLSCCEQSEEVGECLGVGANAFVTKATNLRDFRSRVNSIASFWMQTVHVA